MVCFHSVVCLFALLMILFDVQKLVNFMWSYLSILRVTCYVSGILSRQFSSIDIQSRGFSLAVSTFWVWNQGLWPISSWFLFQGERYGSNLILLQVTIQFYWPVCWTGDIFLSVYSFWSFWQNLGGSGCVGLYLNHLLCSFGIHVCFCVWIFERRSGSQGMTLTLMRRRLSSHMS